MPTYGYRCKSCNHSFEVVQAVSDEPIKECPECAGAVGKIFYPVGIAFKGSGFHVNDYKSNKRTAAEKKDGGGGSGGNGNGGGDAVGCASCASAGACEKSS